MSDYSLSILIPSRNEEFLAKTVEDILSHIEGNTEIIVVMDGAWANPPLADHPRLTVIYHSESIGQRAATNEAARISKAKWVMKVDAHCSFDQGFDVKLMTDMQDDWTVVPLMKNLHVFDWVCPDGHRRYQSPSGECRECGKETVKDVVWIAKHSPKSTSYCFDAEPHFQYFSQYKKRQKGDIVETMSLQGSCFMMTREKYWHLKICDESLGSWGSQGIEVAAKTWLSGGRVMCNTKTWYSHCFRTQGGDFGFPYPQQERKVQEAKNKVRELVFGGKLPYQIHPLSWLVEKFWPVQGWTEEDLKKIQSEPKLTKGIIYYTDNALNLKISHAVQGQLKSIGLPIVSVSLKPMTFGQNVHLPLKRGVQTMYQQIIAALETSTADIVYFCEHDVLYHPSHFEFTPTKPNIFYYNYNVYKFRDDGQALWVDACRQVSGLCGFRVELLQHYRERLAFVQADAGLEHRIGYEPGTRQNWEKKDGTKYQFANVYTDEKFMSALPNVDIRHDNNLTKNRWRKEEFHNQKNTIGWKFVDSIPGWGDGKKLAQRVYGLTANKNNK